MVRKLAQVPRERCVACGCCAKVCPLGAVAVYQGIYAQVDASVPPPAQLRSLL